MSFHPHAGMLSKQLIIKENEPGIFQLPPPPPPPYSETDELRGKQKCSTQDSKLSASRSKEKAIQGTEAGLTPSITVTRVQTPRLCDLCLV